jgi:hypothetical protein
METTMYFLSKDCFVCNTQDYWIILSASRDKYLCVTHADLASIARRLHGWRDLGSIVEHFPQFGVEADANAKTDALIASLTSNGVITSKPSEGKPFVECECPARDRAMEAFESNAPIEYPLFSVIHFFIACARVDWQLRTKQFSRTLARIERRRLRVPLSAGIHSVGLASRLIAAFKNLRPLYPRPYLCLFDSLAMLEFLASYRFLPQVVFGVIADPFQAHCWLQEGNVVLNDDLERVGKYKPILSM